MDVFISCNGMDPNWIVGHIFKDLQFELLKNGIQCSFGSSDEYNNQEICFHVGWAYSKPELKANKNFLFITHLDDKLKERHILSSKDLYDGFITMSKSDADYLFTLGFDKSKIHGIDLPVRNKYIKPLSLGIFSACYPDGRKNENWIIDFLTNKDLNKYLNLIYIGPGWGNHISQLEKLDISFEWHCASRDLKSEYEFQQRKLINLDYYFYLGNDGGAMGTYDAYANNIALLITNQSYHKSIPDARYRFNNFDQFTLNMEEIINKHIKKVNFFEDKGIENYTHKIINIFSGQKNTTIFKETNYKHQKISLKRILSSINRKFYKLFNIKY